LNKHLLKLGVTRQQFEDRVHDHDTGFLRQTFVLLREILQSAIDESQFRDEVPKENVPKAESLEGLQERNIGGRRKGGMFVEAFKGEVWINAGDSYSLKVWAS